jgi:transposase
MQQEGMAMTIVETTHPVTAGVDTHAEIDVAAVVDHLGGVLGIEAFETTEGGYRRLIGWLCSHGEIEQVGVEGTGSYGAALTRHLDRAGIAVVEVDRPNRQVRRREGKSDPVDAVTAARAALAGRALGRPKSRSGDVEAIRVLSVARRSAASQRIATLNPSVISGSCALVTNAVASRPAAVHGAVAIDQRGLHIDDHRVGRHRQSALPTPGIDGAS